MQDGGSLSDAIDARIEALDNQAQVAAMDRLERSYHEMMTDEEYDGPGSPPCAPFCGCFTCIVREVLDASYPYLREAARLEIEG